MCWLTGAASRSALALKSRQYEATANSMMPTLRGETSSAWASRRTFARYSLPVASTASAPLADFRGLG